MALAEKFYPKKLAFQYLDELCREFTRCHGAEIATFSRPYQAINFDPRLTRIRRDYLDPQSPKNVQKLNADLTEIHSIMMQNINDLLRRGEALDRVSTKGSALLTESKQFDRTARLVNLQALYKSIAPLAAIALVILFVLWWGFRG
eukprot:EW706470.1.p1 GENE.EW706470.1~~EW706470.1.p1  ORF type:complete len:146 (+),score=50.19 EW706470.1:153-590(+)